MAPLRPSRSEAASWLFSIRIPFCAIVIYTREPWDRKHEVKTYELKWWYRTVRLLPLREGEPSIFTNLKKVAQQRQSWRTRRNGTGSGFSEEHVEDHQEWWNVSKELEDWSIHVAEIHWEKVKVNMSDLVTASFYQSWCVHAILTYPHTQSCTG